MNFKFGHFLSLYVSFILGAFFCLVGVAGLILPWSVTFQKALINLIFEHTLILSLFGLGGILIGLSLITYATFNSGRHFAFVKIGSRSIAIDENLVEQYLQNYWKKNFPSTSIPFYFSIKKNSIQVVTDLPFLADNTAQDHCLEKIQKDFSQLFGDTLGYPNEVHFIAHFQEKPF